MPLVTDARDRDAVRDLGRVLDSLGLVVEGVEHVGARLDGVVLARVEEIRAIAGADRIREVIVDAGDAEPLQIVCGAINFAVGDIVPLARVGAELPGGMVIGRRKMRGILSEGMLCSGRELGIGDDGAGLLVVASTGSASGALPAGLELGAPLAGYLGIVPDAVFDLAIEPNRPDCLSVIGVARDLAARLGLPFEVSVPAPHRSGAPAGAVASLAVQATDACRHIIAMVVSGVPAGASPPAVARRLLLSGMRPINTVVDSSNYVMLELGQPTHPYDLDALGGHGISVRFARSGERLVTLDGSERVLGTATDAIGRTFDVDDLLICDANDNAVGLAGVMGGASSEIGESTTRVLLEAAEFDPVVIARTAKRQGVRSEASARFERGIDPSGLERAAERFCALLTSAAAHAGVAPPIVAPGDLDEHPRPHEPRRLRLRIGRTNALLGTSLDAGDVEDLIAPIGFQVVGPGQAARDVPRDGPDGVAPGDTAQDPSVLDVAVPSFRPDVEREVDLIEEVARHYGYERIERTHRRSPYVGSLGAENQLRRRLRRLLAGLGAHEAWTSSIVDPSVGGRAGSDAPGVALANPMVREESVLRSELLTGLLLSLRTNVGHRNAAVRLFEIGRVFKPALSGSGLPIEREHVALLLAFETDDASTAMRAWRTIADGLLLEARAVTLEQPIASGTSYTRANSDALGIGLHPSRRGLLRADLAGVGEIVGALGEVDPEVLSAFSLPVDRRVGWLVLDLAQLALVPRRDRRARPVSRFPSSDIDLSFVLDDGTPAAALETLLEEAAGSLGESVRLLDVYRGPGVERGARGLTYRIRFCAVDRTLTDAEVAQLRTACIEIAASGLAARLRA